MRQSVEHLVASAEHLAQMFTQIDTQLDSGDYAIAQVVVGITQQMLSDLQVKVGELKDSVEQQAAVAKMLRSILDSSKQTL